MPRATTDRPGFWRVLKPQLIGVFVGVVTVAIIVTGYLFNAVL